MQNWKTHENHVASVYRMLGYTVRANLQISGKQVDFTCEKWIGGAGKTVLYVDAKYTLEGDRSSVSVSDVEQFIASFESRRIREGWTGAVLVSNKPFTQFAHALAATHSAVYLKTIDDLYEDALALRPYLHNAVEQYQQDEIHQTYIPLRAKGVDGNLQAQGEALDLYSAFEAWLVSKQAPHLCILGDFGCGKTTFLKYIQYRLATAYLSGASTVAPLYIELRRLVGSRDAREFLEIFATDSLGTRVPFQIFEQFANQGRFVFLLDGFDEMGAAKDRLALHRNYLKLTPLFTKASKTALSCRPAYFPSSRDLATTFGQIAREQMPPVEIRRGSSKLAKDLKFAAERVALHVAAESLETLLNRATGSLDTTAYYHLQLFTNDQIVEYVEQFDSSIRKLSEGQMTAKALAKMIHGIYDLDDLAQRPILLNLIVRTLPLFVRSSSGIFTAPTVDKAIKVREITPSLLYYVYTMAEMTREYAKGEMRWDLEKSDRVRLLKQFAFMLAASSRTSANRQELSSLVEDTLHPPSDALDLIVSDMCVFSFLVRDEAEQVRFAHKSLLEYFAGEYLVDLLSQLPDATYELLSKHLLSDEVLFFAGSAALTRLPSALTSVRDELEAHRDHRFVYNALTFLAHGRSFPALIHQKDTDSLLLRRLDADIQNFQDSTYGRVEFRRCQLRQLNFTEVRVSRLVLNECELGATFLRASKCDELQASGTTMTLYSEDSSVGEVRVLNSAVDGRIIRGEFRIVSVRGSTVSRLEVEEALVSIDKGAFVSCQVGVIRLRNCILIHVDLDESWVQSTAFEECIFIGCKVQNLVLDPRFVRCRGVLISDSKNSGVVNGMMLDDSLWGWATAAAVKVLDYKAEELPPRFDWHLLKAFPTGGQRSGRWKRDEVLARIRVIQAKTENHRAKVVSQIRSLVPEVERCCREYALSPSEARRLEGAISKLKACLAEDEVDVGAFRSSLISIRNGIKLASESGKVTGNKEFPSALRQQIEAALKAVPG